MDSLHTVLGAINFAAGNGGGWRLYSGLLQPLNAILISPHTTIHNARGALDYSGFYYHPWFPPNLYSSGVNVERVSGVAKGARNLLSATSRLPVGWSERAQRALRTFDRAFSAYDPVEILRVGWSLLELVGGFSQSDHKRVVRRAASFFSDHAYYRALGSHLLARRNSLTHAGESYSEATDSVSFQLREFLTPIMHHYVSNPFGFENEDEFFKFCDAPEDSDARERMIYVLECAGKFRAPLKK